MSVSNLARLADTVVWLGIDVSKKTLDAAIWIGGAKYKTIRVSNNATGLVKLLAWAKELAGEKELRACMEATGDYGVLAALFFTESKVAVSIVNPASIKYYGIGLGRQNKTDKASAMLIEQYARERNPAPWAMRDPVRMELFRLHRRRTQLVKMIRQEENRKECPVAIGEACLGSINAILKALRSEIRQVENRLDELIRENANLKVQAELIQSISVLGQACTWVILAELPAVDDCPCAASFAAAAGVNSTQRESGTSVKSAPMSKRGQTQVRATLFMPTLTAKRKMLEITMLYNRLKAKGLKHKQIMVACIRKLLMIVYGVLKSQTPYEPREPRIESRVAT